MGQEVSSGDAKDCLMGDKDPGSWSFTRALPFCPGVVSDSKGPYQDQLIVGQLSCPVGFGAIPLKKSLCAVNLVLVLPSGQTLQGRKTISDINYGLGSGVGENTKNPGE